VCRVAVASFGVDRSSVPGARRWARGVLVTWSLEHVTEITALLLSETVTNAIVHTASRPTVRLAASRGFLEVGVDDEWGLPDQDRLGGLRPATTGPDLLLAEGGRGLQLIEALADEWGVIAITGGKQVWFRLDLGDWPYRADCLCDHHGIADVVLRSGLHANHMHGPWSSDSVRVVPEP
jgi:anti-sigma regulatory factor (Ser/Thr protein kinase)